MYRLDEHWEWTGKYEAPGVTMKPSQYLARNCFLSCEADERASRHYVEEFGDDNVVFSTDYPHADSKFPHATETVLTLPLTNSSKKKILWDNYCKLYHVKISAQADGGEMR
jgi:predicted TIM-barrel fold metal-dependent hydrolase